MLDLWTLQYGCIDCFFHSHESMSWQQWNSPELHAVTLGTAIGCCWITTVVAAMMINLDSLTNMKDNDFYVIEAVLLTQPLGNNCNDPSREVKEK